MASGTPLLWERGGRVDPCPSDLGPPGAASIDTFDGRLLVGGWFVMFPTAGLPAADAQAQWMHGEAARLPWTVTHLDAQTVTAELHTPSSGFQLTRTLRLDDEGLFVQTTAVNRSGAVREITYGEHPCLSRPAFAGGRLDIAVRAATVLPPAQPAAASVAPGPVARWPRATAWHTSAEPDCAIDLGTVPVRPDGAHDHISVDLADGTVAISAPGLGRVLRITVDPSELGHVLLWRHHQPRGRPWVADVFAPEPSSSPGRGWPDAVAAGAVRVVAPDEAVTFTVRGHWATSLG